jgi:hypothetical protein
LIVALLVRQHTENPAVALLACGIFFCFGILTFIRGFRLLQRRRLILDTPFSRIRSASLGMVELSGLAVGPYTMIAPITAHACYYYRTLVWELKQQGKNKQWVKVAGECLHLPFFVDDNTGCVMIDPRGADLDLHRDFEQEFCDSFFTTKEPAPPNVVSFLARHGVATRNKIKVEEFCVKPKNALFVLGTLAENPGVEVTAQPVQDHEALGSLRSGTFSISLNLNASMPESDLAHDAFTHQPAIRSGAARPELIRLTAETGPLKTADMTQQQKIAAALLKAGISNPAAWSVAEKSAARLSAAGLSTPQVQVVDDLSAKLSGESGGNGDGNDDSNSMAKGSPVQAASGQPDGFVLHPPVVLMKGSNNKTFLISWRSQQEVARSLAWKNTLMIWGGPLISLLSLYIILSAYHLI